MPSSTPAAAARALVGRGLADRLDRQPLHLGAGGSSGRSGRRRGRRRTGCRARSARSRRRWWRARRGARCAGCEHPVLLGRRQPRVQRHDLECPRRSSRRASASAVSRISRSPDRKTRMSPGPSRAQLGDRVDDGLDLVARRRRPVVLVVRRRRLLERPVADLDRVGPPGHLDRSAPAGPGSAKCAANRSGSMVAEVMITLRSGRRGSSRVQVAEEEVDVQAALVRLVDDERVVAAAAAGRAASRRAGCRRSSA